MFVLSIPTSKISNLLLLFLLYVVLLLCLVLVVRYEYAFRKPELTYGLNFQRLSVATAFVLFNTALVTTLKLRDFHYSICCLILIFFVLPSCALFAYVRDYDARIFLSHNFFLLATLLFGRIKLKIRSSRFDLHQS